MSFWSFKGPNLAIYQTMGQHPVGMIMVMRWDRYPYNSHNVSIEKHEENLSFYHSFSINIEEHWEQYSIDDFFSTFDVGLKQHTSWRSWQPKNDLTESVRIKNTYVYIIYVYGNIHIYIYTYIYDIWIHLQYSDEQSGTSN